MFLYLLTFAVGLIALTAGVALYVKSLQGGPGRYLARFFGFVIMVLALSDMAFTVCIGTKQWLRGDYVVHEVNSSMQI